MPRSFLTLRALVMDPTEHGLWCDSCALPSAMRFPILWYEEDTLRVALRMTVVTCPECFEGGD